LSTQKLTNITIKKFKKFLKNAGCGYLRTNSGHEIWGKQGLTRPVTFQTHIDPVPELVIQSNLKTLSLDKKDFFKILNQRKKPPSQKK